MSERLRLEVVTPQRRVLEEEADEVRLPGTLGELGVLPGHTPLLTTLAIGPLTIVEAGKERAMALFGGFAEVLPDKVTVLAGGIEDAADIDVEAARKEKSAAEEALKNASAEEIEEIRKRLMAAETRLQVAGGDAA